MHVRQLSFGVALSCFVSFGAIAEPPIEPRSVDPPAKQGSLAPNLWTGDGSTLLSWLEPIEGERGTFAFRFARFERGDWSEPHTIVERGDFFANWADLPSITRHPDGWHLAHWLQKSGPGPYAYDVMLAQSSDAGATWTALGPLHNDGTQTEHGFVSRVIEGDDIRVFWLDGREMAPDPDADGDGHGMGDMQLRAAVVRPPSGAASPLAPGESIVLDPRVCECCGTDAAVTANGPIVVYRGRSEGEVRDILIVRRVNGHWTKPATIHDDDWGISGCPVNGPAVAARGEHVVVAWHTGAGMEPRVQVAFSSDSGATFSAPIVIDNDEPPGRVDVAMAEDGAAFVVWLGRDEEGGVIRLQRVKASGADGDPVTVARTTAARNSGFPRIGLHGKDLLVVWRDARNRVRAATLLAN